jgi:hypothetical protein
MDEFAQPVVLGTKQKDIFHGLVRIMGAKQNAIAPDVPIDDKRVGVPVQIQRNGKIQSRKPDVFHIEEEIFRTQIRIEIGDIE